MRAFDKDKDDIITVEEFVTVLVDPDRGADASLSDAFIASNLFDPRLRQLQMKTGKAICVL